MLACRSIYDAARRDADARLAEDLDAAGNNASLIAEAQQRHGASLAAAHKAYLDCLGSATIVEGNAR